MKRLEGLLKYLRARSAERGYTCDKCGAELFDYPLHRLCAACEGELQRNDRNTCPKCGRKTVSEGVCMSCKAKPPAFTRGVSPFVYGGEAAGLVNLVKNGRRRLAQYLGEQTAEAFLKEFPEADGLLLVPVPTTAQKRRERGYNQAEDIACAAYDRLLLRGKTAELDTEVLVCRREGVSQKYLSQTERSENARGAYRVHKRKACRDRTVLLIDDIMTTGATGSEAARLLLGAGAKEVYFLVAAALPEKF